MAGFYEFTVESLGGVPGVSWSSGEMPPGRVAVRVTKEDPNGDRTFSVNWFDKDGELAGNVMFMVRARKNKEQQECLSA